MKVSSSRPVSDSQASCTARPAQDFTGCTCRLAMRRSVSAEFTGRSVAPGSAAGTRRAADRPLVEPPRLRTGERGERKTTWMELFFDLVFVFAITQVSHLLLEHLTWAGVGESVLVLLVVFPSLSTWLARM